MLGTKQASMQLNSHMTIIMQKFYERRNTKIDVKKKVRAVIQSRVVQAVLSRFQTPSTKFIIKAAVAFLVLAVLMVLFPSEEGPGSIIDGYHVLHTG